MKAKRKIHNNLGHKEHSTHFPHPHNLFVNILQIFTPHPQKPQFYIEPHEH